MNTSGINRSFFDVWRRLLPGLLILVAGAHPLLSQTAWVRQLGGTGSDIAVCTVADLSGHVYTIGTFSNNADFGPYTLSSVGKGDIFITCMDAETGELSWVRHFGGTDEDNGGALICDPSGNVYCTGRFSGPVAFGTTTLSAQGGSDGFLARLDPQTGSVIWATKIGGTGNDGGLALSSDQQGNIYACGYFQGAAAFGTVALQPTGPNLNVFLLRVGPGTGNIVWAKGYGSSGHSYGTALSCDPSGNIYMAGHYEGEIAVGNHTLSSVQHLDIFTSRHSASSGEPLWAYTAGGEGNDNAHGILAGPDGEIYVTGKFEGACAFGSATLSSAGSADIFVAKRRASDGSLVWARRFGSGGYEQATCLAKDAQGHLFLTGQFNGFVDFDDFLVSSSGSADVFIAKLDLSGAVLWADAMGGQASDAASWISTGPDDALYCTGWFQSEALLGGHSLRSRGSTDAFVLRLKSVMVGLPEHNTAQGLSLQLMPVPCGEVLTLSLIGAPLELYEISISEVSGRTRLTFPAGPLNGTLDVSRLEPGIYFLMLSAAPDAPIVRKFIRN
jgi:outer membrane protein assembly factor BamB